MKKGSGTVDGVAAEVLHADEQPRRYPEYLMPIAGQLVRDEAFAEARAEFLAGFHFNTARAYWSDLDDIWIWASERGKNVLALTEADVKAYVRLLRRRGYAASTVRRRRTALHGFQGSLEGSASRRNRRARAASTSGQLLVTFRGRSTEGPL